MLDTSFPISYLTYFNFTPKSLLISLYAIAYFANSDFSFNDLFTVAITLRSLYERNVEI